jgi:hypothetical protein
MDHTIINDDVLYIICKKINTNDIITLFKALYRDIPIPITRICIKNTKKYYKNKYNFNQVCRNCTTVNITIPKKSISNHIIKTDPGVIYALDIRGGLELDQIIIETNNTTIENFIRGSYPDDVQKRISYPTTKNTNGIIKIKYIRNNDLNKKIDLQLTVHIWDVPS